MGETGNRIARVEIENPGVVRYHPDVEREIQVAIYDLVETNLFAPVPEHFGSAAVGPFDLVLRAQGRQLVFDVAAADGAPVGAVSLPLAPSARPSRTIYGLRELLRGHPHGYAVADRGDRYGPARVLHNEGSDAARDFWHGQDRARSPDRSPPVHAALCVAVPGLGGDDEISQQYPIRMRPQHHPLSHGGVDHAPHRRSARLVDGAGRSR